MAKDCICNNASTFDINKIVPGPKKDFVVLNREYSKQNPLVHRCGSMLLTCAVRSKGARVPFMRLWG